MQQNVTIRKAVDADARDICEIYNHYVTKTTVTFEENPVPEDAMRQRMVVIQKDFPYLCCEKEGRVCGYAYLNSWKARSAYRHTAESTVYLRDGEQGGGIGTRLYAALLDEAVRSGLHTVIGVVALPNEACRRMNEKLGFDQVAHFRQVGWKFGRWLDVGCWQKILS
jgi:phosphinothricin acetyltransferase